MHAMTQRQWRKLEGAIGDYHHVAKIDLVQTILDRHAHQLMLSGL